MTQRELLTTIKMLLQKVHGDRLKRVILYGSEARGESGPDSDIDVLVVLEGPVDYLCDLKNSIHALYPLTLQLGRPLSPKVASTEEYERRDCPLFRTLDKEGIVA
jgi:predicted nucleotidyltransferase